MYLSPWLGPLSNHHQITLLVSQASVQSGLANVQSTAVLPKAVRTPPVIQLLNVQKGINCTNYMLTTCSVPSFVMYKTNMENEKSNVTSHYAKTYTTINCKT